MTLPTPSMLKAMREQIETAGIPDPRKLDRALVAAWRAAEAVRWEEAGAPEMARRYRPGSSR